MPQLSHIQEKGLLDLLDALIDQNAARPLVTPYAAASGYWFGGGNLVQDRDGTLWLSGRYRNFGDSRTGLAAGQRGLECALFRSTDGGGSFEKVKSWTKADLSTEDVTVLSIEGTSLHQRSNGTWELFVSSEKEEAYPEALQSYQKPGTGVWSIDRMEGPSPDNIDPATLRLVLANRERPEYLHVKDPVVFDWSDGATVMIFCSHPFSWSSSNTGLAIRGANKDSFEVETWEIVDRGATWDVAATRITGRLAVPQVGCFADSDAVSVYFYDGAESLRQLDESPQAHRRPRGYSCEEIGGAFVGFDAEFPNMTRLSRLFPLFISPWGTGCSRYVETLVTEQGIYAIWQQSQTDESQPLVGTFLPMTAVVEILSGQENS